MSELTPGERLAALETHIPYITKALKSGEVRMGSIEGKLDTLVARTPWKSFAKTLAAVMGVSIPACALAWGIASKKLGIE